MDDLLTAILGALEDNRPLMSEFEAICDFGGRFSGTESEKRAVSHLKRRMAEISGGAAQVFPTAYDGWRRETQELTRLTPSVLDLECTSLVWSPSTPPGGLEAEVVDLGRGELAAFKEKAGELRGRIPLVRHEYMFTENTLHRRYKYDAAREAGAAAFLIANYLPDVGLLSGSSGRNRPSDIPACAISAESAATLTAATDGYPRVRLTVQTASSGDTAESLYVELPGALDEWVVLSAHIDGHPFGESAMDNATGLAIGLRLFELMRMQQPKLKRGLRLMFFNVEEWGLWGSRDYVEGLSDEERAKIKLNVNLDSVAGAPDLTAITSEFSKLPPFLSSAASACDVPLACHDALMRNSDHYNFAVGGIPAFRLVAGFDQPESHLRYVLTREDTRDKIAESEMRQAARLTASIVVSALMAETLDLRM